MFTIYAYTWFKLENKFYPWVIKKCANYKEHFKCKITFSNTYIEHKL